MAPSKRTPATGLALAIILVFLLFAIVAWVLIVAGLSRQEWVSGNQSVNRTSVDVGLFRECKGNSCYYTGSDMNIDIWRAAAAFFVIGVLLLSAAIIMAFVCLCVLRLLIWTKLVLSIANLCFTIAIVLIPIGFTYLDDACPGSGNQSQCGLICDSTGRMDFFSLCSPFKVGAALWVVIAGIFILFLGSIILSCLQTFTYTVTSEEQR